MCIKHLRRYLLQGVSSPSDFEAFCVRFGARKIGGSRDEQNSFETLFKAKARQCGMSSVIAEDYLASMRGDGAQRPSGGVDETGFDGALLPSRA